MIDISHIKVKPTAARIFDVMDTDRRSWAGYYVINKHTLMDVPNEVDTFAKYLSLYSTYYHTTHDRLEFMATKQYLLRVDTDFFTYTIHAENDVSSPIVNGGINCNVIQYTMHDDVPLTNNEVQVVCYYPTETDLTLTHALGLNTPTPIYDNTPVIKNITGIASYTH
jgi:hypothetical protein